MVNVSTKSTVCLSINGKVWLHIKNSKNNLWRFWHLYLFCRIYYRFYLVVDFWIFEILIFVCLPLIVTKLSSKGRKKRKVWICKVYLLYFDNKFWVIMCPLEKSYNRSVIPKSKQKTDHLKKWSRLFGAQTRSILQFCNTVVKKCQEFL